MVRQRLRLLPSSPSSSSVRDHPDGLVQVWDDLQEVAEDGEKHHSDLEQEKEIQVIHSNVFLFLVYTVHGNEETLF